MENERNARVPVDYANASTPDPAPPEGEAAERESWAADLASTAFDVAATFPEATIDVVSTAASAGAEVTGSAVEAGFEVAAGAVSAIFESLG